MENQACPLPGRESAEESANIQRMLKARSIAVVGLSDDPARPSYEVAEYLQRHGYKITPVNPNAPEVLGEPAVASLRELSQPPDVVLVFRRSEHCADVAREAIAVGVRGIWLQAGIRSDEAKNLAAAAGISFVQDRCMMVEHRRRR